MAEVGSGTVVTVAILLAVLLVFVLLLIFAVLMLSRRVDAVTSQSHWLHNEFWHERPRAIIRARSLLAAQLGEVADVLQRILNARSDALRKRHHTRTLMALDDIVYVLLPQMARALALDEETTGQSTPEPDYDSFVDMLVDIDQRVIVPLRRNNNACGLFIVYQQTRLYRDLQHLDNIYSGHSDPVLDADAPLAILYSARFIALNGLDPPPTGVRLVSENEH